MFMRNRLTVIILALGLVALVLSSHCPADAATKAEIDRDVKVALQNLYEKHPTARMIGEKAKGILVFPSIVKAGFIFGGQYGDGALLRDGKTAGYYNTVAASYGLQAGVQEYGYAMFLMTDSAIAYLDKSEGWEVGVGPSVVIVDAETAAAFGKSMTSTTLKDDVYAFIFSQKGLMAGLGLQGSKITRIHPK